MLDGQKLDSLFEGYGFQARKQTADVRAYIRRSGYFQNAEIVPLTENAFTDEVAKDLQRSGLSCKISRFKTVEDAERALFEGFFQQDLTRARLQREHSDFTDRKSQRLGVEYAYIQAPYLVDGRTPEHTEVVTGEILKQIDGPGPVLVLLEAAAGFGKTCTAFEVLRLLLDAPNIVNPILMELQRHRQARIFRYLLLEEIDRNYEGLTAVMVTREIRSGRIPLIIDGFDELLHLDRDGDTHADFADVEPMLRTLEDILVSNAKVVVTTRRTAVLGAEFDEWLAELAAKQIVVRRLTLLEPRVDDWIGAKKRRAIEEKGLPLRSIANPVLLAYLRSLDEPTFEGLCGQACDLVDKYFAFLLDRERERQELPLSVSSQMDILKSLASFFIECGSSASTREEIKRIILHTHYPLLKEALRSTTGIAATTPEELADKLTDHALLDRKAGKVELIGFVNDFVHGSLGGLAMLDLPSEKWFNEADMDKATTAFSFRRQDDRTLLWNRLLEPAGAMETSWQVQFDMRLLNKINRPLKDAMVQDTSFVGLDLGREHELQNVVFLRCSFEKVSFYGSGIQSAGFSACVLKKCTIAQPLQPGGCWFDASSEEYDGNVISEARRAGAMPVEQERQPEDFVRVVLEQFWPPGRGHARPTLRVSTLYQGVDGRNRQSVNRAVDALRDQGLLTIKDRLAELDFGKMARIRTLLGR